MLHRRYKRNTRVLYRWYRGITGSYRDVTVVLKVSYIGNTGMLNGGVKEVLQGGYVMWILQDFFLVFGTWVLKESYIVEIGCITLVWQECYRDIKHLASVFLHLQAFDYIYLSVCTFAYISHFFKYFYITCVFKKKI